MRACPDPRCHIPDVNCFLGEETPAECSVWCGSKSDDAEPSLNSTAGTDTLLPWSGSALGTGDLAFLTARGEAKVVALLGAHNAGKTTLLAAWYQRLGRRGLVGKGRFSGSFSLEGWEAVSHALRWEGGAPRFPPHTSSGAGRAPGMLHLAIRDENSRLSDFLFADSPGEWFERWAVDRDAGDAEGARWLVDRASSLIIIADCEALAGEERGRARSDIIQLIRRVANERNERPVALIWSKADVVISQPIRDAIRDAAARVMPDIKEFSSSIIDFNLNGVKINAEQALVEILTWALQPVSRGFAVSETGSSAADPFFNFGSMS